MTARKQPNGAYAIRKLIDEFIAENTDEANQPFVAALMPTLDPATVHGIKTPPLRALAKELAKRDDVDEFLADLPHRHFEENQIHAFIIGQDRDYDRVIERLEPFLPYVDNWATCDQMNPKVLAKRPEETLGHIRTWMASPLTYTIRFGILMLMHNRFLDERFKPQFFEWVIGVESEEYYVNIMRAWYFAEALAKQPELATEVIESRRLDTWTHNKAIQKARESRRVDTDLKEYLATLRIKAKRS